MWGSFHFKENKEKYKKPEKNNRRSPRHTGDLLVMRMKIQGHFNLDKGVGELHCMNLCKINESFRKLLELASDYPW